MELQIFDNKEAVAKAFAQKLQEIINNNSRVNIALSGGSTPKAIFDYMSVEYKDSIDWNNVHFFWGDERCVPADHDESNYKMTHDHLFSKIGFPIDNVHRIVGENTPDNEAVSYAQEIETLVETKSDQVPSFDLIILGMGDDGHTASIFPHEINLWDDESLCTVANHPVSGQKRVSFTGKLINAAKEVAFLVTGDNKAEKVRAIVNEEGDFQQYPASLVKPVSDNLLWFLDKPAAALL